MRFSVGILVLLGGGLLHGQTRPFDSSRYQLLPPLEAPTLPSLQPLLPTKDMPARPPVKLAPGMAMNKPCAVARVVKPRAVFDSGILPRGLSPVPQTGTPPGIRTNPHDLTEDKVPAPSCADLAAVMPRRNDPQRNPIVRPR
jgi:hypothetical protein